MDQIRSFIIRASIVIGIIFLMLLCGGYILATYGPLHPGNFAFPVQYFIEQERRLTYSDPDQRASYSLDILERRVNDLSLRAGTDYELVSISYLDGSLDQVTEDMSISTKEIYSELRVRFYSSVAFNE